jgi:hypothetical protein
MSLVFLKNLIFSLRGFHTVPVTVVTDGPHVTLAGGNVTLRCVTQGVPRPHYEWVLGQGFVGLLYILIVLSICMSSRVCVFTYLYKYTVQ